MNAENIIKDEKNNKKISQQKDCVEYNEMKIYV